MINSIPVHKLIIEHTTQKSISEVKQHLKPFKKIDIQNFLEFIYSAGKKYTDSEPFQKMCKLIGFDNPQKIDLVERRRNLINDEKSKDFTIINQKNNNQKIKVHKIVLIAKTGLFPNLFSSIQENDNLKSINHKLETSFESLRFFISHLYTNDSFEHNLKPSCINELLQLLDYYLLPTNNSLFLHLNYHAHPEHFFCAGEKYITWRNKMKMEILQIKQKEMEKIKETEKEKEQEKEEEKIMQKQKGKGNGKEKQKGRGRGKNNAKAKGKGKRK
ncbi:hypothetical protein M0812_30056 [Anaeramoeba flamelloides]|uniref:BTB domain-containing protein n=1 Tax=Anaeramoeba flamelloides TaxID=1746091 RepID=A0AAV7Y4J6_9EUKA|nr:hypothetical protein M0812_30056 [Anaeramoeba flamelloides]